MGLVDRNPKTVLGVSFVVAAGLLGGAAVAYVNAGGGGSTSAVSPVVTPGPTAVASPEPTVETPAPAPSPTATAVPTATVTASPSASPSVAPSATATATGTPTRTYPYPAPSQTYAGLVLSATLNPGGGTTATPFDLRMKATDGDGEIYFDGLTWGDGGAAAADASPQKCGTYPPLTSKPGAYQPSPDEAEFRKGHTYPRAGTYTLTAHVSSVSKDCKPNGPAKETRTVTFTVRISAAPTASPSASPTPSPTASSTPSP